MAQWHIGQSEPDMSSLSCLSLLLCAAAGQQKAAAESSGAFPVYFYEPRDQDDLLDD